MTSAWKITPHEKKKKFRHEYSAELCIQQLYKSMEPLGLHPLNEIK
jgi:hypothetical protein